MLYTTTRTTTTFTTAEGLNDFLTRKGFDAISDEDIRRAVRCPLTNQNTYMETVGGTYIARMGSQSFRVGVWMFFDDRTKIYTLKYDRVTPRLI